MTLRFSFDGIFNSHPEKDQLHPELSPSVLREKASVVEHIYDIFSADGPLDNQAVLVKLDSLVSNITNELSESEMKEFNKIKKKSGFSRKVIELVDLPIRNSWKIDVLFFLGEAKKRIQERIKIIDSFKAGDRSVLDDKFPSGSEYRSEIDNPKTKVFYTPFGITFYIPPDARQRKVGGLHFPGTPFSIVYSISGKFNVRASMRKTFDHEARHNMYHLMGLSISGERGTFLEIKRALEKYIQKEMKLKRDSEGQDSSTKRMCRILSGQPENIADFDIAGIHIRGLKNELLANFDNLLEGQGSTDMNYSQECLKGKYAIELYFEDELKDTEFYGKKDQVVRQYIARIHEFYQRLSRLCFIAKMGGKKQVEKLRQLLYILDMDELEVVEAFFRDDLGDDIYNSLQTVYPALTTVDLERALLGQEQQMNHIERLALHVFDGRLPRKRDVRRGVTLQRPFEDMKGHIKPEYSAPEFYHHVQRVQAYVDTLPPNREYPSNMGSYLARYKMQKSGKK